MPNRPLTLVNQALTALILIATAIPVGIAQPQPMAPAGVALPRLGEGGGLDLLAERHLGDRIGRELLQSPEVFDDPVLDGHLQRLWQPLLREAQTQGHLEADMLERFAWRLVLVKDRSVNAFALPGGYLGVHLGLLATVTSADELASVLAHELSHVTQRHISRMVAQQERQAPLVVGAMVLGALAASQSRNADVMQAAVVGGQALAIQSQLNFTRDMEREADRMGFSVMTGAGFDGLGFVSLFDKLQQASRLNDDGSFPYLRSHPLSTERIADMTNRLTASRPTGATTPRPVERGAATLKGAVSPVWHALAAARARVLAETDAQRLRALANEGGATPAVNPGRAQAPDAVGRLVPVYTRALAASRLKDHATAVQLATSLVTSPRVVDDARPILWALLLEVGRSAGWPPGSPWAQWAAEALAQPDRMAWLWGAAAAVDLGTPAAASNRLEPWVTAHPQDAPAWQQLARAWAAQQHTLRAVRAEAEARLAVLDLPGAVDRLQAGRDALRRQAPQTAAEHMDASILDARWRELSQRLRDEQRAAPSAR